MEPQMLVYQNFNYLATQANTIQSGIVKFAPIIVPAYVTFSNLHIFLKNAISNEGTLSLSAGLYSLTGSTLTLLNSISGSQTYSAASVYPCNGITDVSAAYNITPGNYWIGFLAKTSSESSISSLVANFYFVINNSFPGTFIGGIMTASTAALPASIETSKLDVLGTNELCVPSIILN
jgi:hypothetical protein